VKLRVLYAAGAWLAGVCMVLIVAITLYQVIGRMVGAAVTDAGELAGYAMAAAIFLSLAYTFQRGGHIRVNLLLAQVRPGWRRALEYWCVGVLAVLGALFAVFAVQMVRDSYAMGDVSTGMLSVPLWIPQISMAAGAILFEIAVLDELVHMIRGHAPRYEQASEGAAFTE
jgi:TRAP-type C4-dicarboxylate transport system permease small subunit